MTLVDDFFEPWERRIDSFDDINSVLTNLFERWVAEGRVFAWRGAVHAAWPLHSSLYRRLLWTKPAQHNALDERDLSREEADVLKMVHQWGLHYGSTGRLSILAQLATLQHFGAPTRLVDVTLNAYIGLWFAVEEKFENGEAVYEDCDGRLFAIDVTRRLINEDDGRRAWEDDLSRPWKDLATNEWPSTTWAWRPAAFQPRIAAQHGAFLLGGVPRTGLELAWPKTTRPETGNWNIGDVRRCTSLPLRFHKAEPEAGGVGRGGQPAFTFRITAAAKRDIRERLTTVFGYSHGTIYPDYPGFAEFGTPRLKDRPPDADEEQNGDQAATARPSGGNRSALPRTTSRLGANVQ